MFDRLIDDVAGRFGLSGDKARQLLGMLAAMIFDQKRGGFAGFIDQFRQKGLGHLAQSWVGTGPNEPISPGQVEEVFGSSAISDMAARLGLGNSAVSGALSGLLPGVVDGLAEDGQMPSGVPDRLRGMLSGLGDWGADLGRAGAGALGAGAAAVGAGMDRVGDAAGDATRAVGAGLDRTSDAIGEGARAVGGGVGRALPWLLLGALLVGAFLWFRGCQRDETTTAPVTTPAETTPVETAEPPVAMIDSRLAITRSGDKVSYEGTVDSEATKASIIDALDSAFGAGNASGNISVDPNARTPGWLAGLAGFLPGFTADGATLTFQGNNIDLSGGIADADRAGLLDKLKGAFGGFSFGGLFADAGAAVERSVEAANAALDKLATGSFSADDLVKALNLMIIHFDTGSASISADSNDILVKAANAIKAAPAGTRIEVGGHTDNTGNAGANQALSQRRAEAVVARLTELGVTAGTLSAKGYGQDKPVADNGTEEGRASNRRIEFTVVP